jgi:3-oxoacyl-[acyl-carrier protein] reductase
LDLELSGKRVWVLGASAGLGRAVAACLASEGAALAISARDRSRLESVAAELRAAGAARVVTRPLDVRHGTDIAAAAEEVITALGGLDIVISNHGGPGAGGFDAVDEAEFTDAYELILASAFRITKAVVSALRSSRGVIIYLTSTSTKEVLPNLLLSNVMRLGVVGLAKSLSRELGADGVRVLCAAPGRIDTERARAIDAAAAQRQGKDQAQIRRASEEALPLRRYGTPEEFGQVVAFLCSSRASYMTGTTVVVDGGRMSGVLS